MLAKKRDFYSSLSTVEELEGQSQARTCLGVYAGIQGIPDSGGAALQRFLLPASATF